MIRTVTGTVDTVPITFTQVSPDRWEIIVPSDFEDGKYIIEITAEDEAGNQSYQIAVLYMYQNVITKFEILQQKYSETLLCDRLNTSIFDKFFNMLVCERIIITSKERFFEGCS